MQVVQAKASVSRMEVTESARRRRRFEAYLEMLPDDDELLDELTQLVEKRLIEISVDARQ